MPRLDPRRPALGERCASMSTLKLLKLPYPFSQAALLNAGQFMKQSGVRGVRLVDGQLEALHRAGALAPLFRVGLFPRRNREAVDLTGSRTAEVVHTTNASELFAAAATGRAADPAIEPYRPWPTKQYRSLWPSAASAFLWSPHQLLGLHVVERLLPKMRYSRDAGARFSVDRLTGGDLEVAAAWRGLAVALTALEAKYLPRITHVVHHDFDAWLAHDAEFDPVETMTWLGTTAQEARAQAEALSSSAAWRDPFGPLYDIVRRCDSSAWDALTGDARRSIDERVAAEMLSMWTDDLVTAGAAIAFEEPPLAQVPLRYQRITDRDSSLDAALSKAGISPFPSLVLALEGKTEMTLMPKVFDRLGIDHGINRMLLVDLHGADADPSLLATHAMPRTGKQLGSTSGPFLMVDRPIARVLIAVDPEGKYGTARQRERLQARLIELITDAVPEEFKADLLDPSAELVEIRTWPRYPFEFAHFTDRELASALRSAASSRCPWPNAELVRRIAVQRSNQSPDVARAWRGWQGCGLSKPRVAEALWPVLAQKIRQAEAKERPTDVPILDLAIRANQLASMRRHGLALRSEPAP
jgi:hypothetical protein